MLSKMRILASSHCELNEGEQHDNSEPKMTKNRRKRGKREIFRGEYVENYKEGDWEGRLTVSSLIASAETLVVCPGNWVT